MAIRSHRTRALVAGALLWIAGCSEPETGPIVVSAIGGPPELVNPNLKRLDAASAFLIEAVGQGLVQFDATGQVQPALAQSWIVSDDGLRYTFRLARLRGPDGEPITAEQVTERLQAVMSRASSNALKSQLGVIEDIEAMTDDVLEISLKSPRPNFLQLLAQPEMGILLDGQGTGPLRIAGAADGAVRLEPPEGDEDDGAAEPEGPRILLRGEPAALAVARFSRGLADLVIGGTAGNLPIARAAEPDAAALRFDPVAGLFGLIFTSDEGWLAAPEVRRALSMAIDRTELVTALGVPELQPRTSLVPDGIEDLPQPGQPAWAADPLPMRREQARQLVETALEGEEPPPLRVAVPEGPGYRLVFAHLRRDWRAIGLRVERVAAGEAADLRLIDRVAPAALAGWYLRRFTCDRSAICDPEADRLLAAARIEMWTAGRQTLMAAADRRLTDATPFIPITAPVRWSLVSPRLTGFQLNAFSRHLPETLVAPAP
ncbi:ABC transporter substrate-binding protein [Sphingosinicella humi]|uniref:ABC transporter substrate-binding protein n=1 Tax=Allosphingosinicella humi TaxID=2068657 RepID=A0A2U2IZE9_9SPHN|nr:ABC transporter substrate-binding protein [Sphingosinicella humi]PWG01448.1 ABC transporter substrate-binding protein [Sphingosinicella humi]